MISKFIYDASLYNEQSAWQVLPWLLNQHPVSSVVDIGCGTGTWLSVANKLGIQDFLGLDCSAYLSDIFHIPQNNYQQVDLTINNSSNRHFDLCICLEVGEHLPLSSAGILVEQVCALAPIILFSAAIPSQPGQGHINAQWPAYWQEKFLRNGFIAYDVLRSEFWNNEKVEWWYRQNMILYAKPGILKNCSETNGQVNSLIHPTLYNMKLREIQHLLAVEEKAVFSPSLFFAIKALAKSILITPWKKNVRKN